MPMQYYKLFDLLNRKHLKKGDLLQVVSSATIAKLAKGGNVNTSVLCDICSYLDCDITDIMEYEKDSSEMRKQPKGSLSEKKKS